MSLLHVRTRRGPIVTGLCVVWLAMSAPSLLSQVSSAVWPVPSWLLVLIEGVTGPNPVDCGQLGAVPSPTDDTPIFTRVIKCGTDAVKAGKPFWMIEWATMADSIVCHGLLGDTKGAIFQFSFDSAPCGGPGCPPRFVVTPCPVPTPQAHGYTCPAAEPAAAEGSPAAR